MEQKFSLTLNCLPTSELLQERNRLPSYLGHYMLGSLCYSSLIYTLTIIYQLCELGQVISLHY